MRRMEGLRLMSVGARHCGCYAVRLFDRRAVTSTSPRHRRAGARLPPHRPAAYFRHSSGEPSWPPSSRPPRSRSTAPAPCRGSTSPRPEILAQELERIFLQRWLCVGREDRIPNPGDYFVQEIGTESVIVLRDRAGGYRAYYNVCRHRGTRLCEEHTGRFSETIQCPYHAWTYSLDGRLIGAPVHRGPRGIRQGRLAAAPGGGRERGKASSSSTWRSDPEPFEQACEPLLGRFSRFNLPNLQGAPDHRVRRAGRNWKLLFQNYSECYHCGPVHPALAKLTPPTSGENDLTEGPFTGGFMVINRGHESLTMSGKSCGVTVGDLPDEDMNRVYYYAIFPNMLLSLHPDYVMFHTLWPKGTDRTQIFCSWLFHPATLERSDIQSGRRGGVLGHDQPAGLAHLRAEPARRAVARLPPGPVLAAGEPVGAVRPRGVAVAGAVGGTAGPRSSRAKRGTFSAQAERSLGRFARLGMQVPASSYRPPAISMITST